MPDLLASQVVREKIPTRLARYLPCPTPFGADVFHTSYYRIPARRVRRYVVTVYDFTYERYRSGLARQVHSAQKALSIRAADLAICISESTRIDLLHFYPDVDPARIVCVPLAVDTLEFYPERIGKDAIGSRPRVLFVGQRGGYKRFDLAVEAVRQLPAFELGVVGPHLASEERDYLQHRLPGRWVAFELPDLSKLRRLYSSAHAFIYPSDYEGFGLPILEAMACGCPVIASNRSSFPEVAGSAALLAGEQSAECYASLIESLNDIENRAALVALGQERAKQFSWDETISQTLALYA